MKVLYLYTRHDEIIPQHVSMLAECLRQSAEIRVADSLGAFRKELQQQLPHIIHCHGLPSVTTARAIISALNRGARLVITPHGQLEPWADDRQRNPAAVYWQKELVRRAYTVILLGRIERTNFEQSRLNHRIREIHNAVITNTISPHAMSADTLAVYQKVLDSDTFVLMDQPTRNMLRTVIKVGILGDPRWAPVRPSGTIDWRQILLYADNENIRRYVDYGINQLRCSLPPIDTSRIAFFLPDGYTAPVSVSEIVGEYQGKETEYILRIISQIREQPILLHLIELTRELYRDTVDDEQLAEALRDKGLAPFSRALMQVLSETTGLDEGYMPLPPADNSLTQQIRRQLTNHLKI